MNILTRYIARDFFRYWFACLAAIVALVAIGALFDDIEKAFASWHEFRAFLYTTAQSLPTLLEQLLPMTVLLATMFTFSAYGRTSELVAMKAAGMGMMRLIFPLLAVLVMVSSLAYLNQNYLYRYLHSDLDTRNRGLVRQWRSIGNAIVFLESIDPDAKVVVGVKMFLWRKDPFSFSQVNTFSVGRRTDEELWRFTGAAIREQDAATWRIETSVEKDLSARDFPDVFRPAELDAHHMPLLDLYQEIQARESQGLGVELYRLEWYQKLAAMTAPWVMVLLGTPLSQGHFRRGRVTVDVLITITMGLVFMIGTEIFHILGRGGIVPVWPSVWATNIIVALLGIGLMRLSR
jgi:lipopolysaccharide export system permease protein